MKKILISLLFLSLTVLTKAQVSIVSGVKSLTTPSICMVTCNEPGTFNEIRWTHSLLPDAVTMVILRSSKDDKYIEIGRVAANVGVFTDNSGDVKSTSYKYKIQYEDKDGKLSGQSSSHQSILIKGDQKGVFTWNAYDIAPKDPQGKVVYHFWRQETGKAPKKLLCTEMNKAADPEFADQIGKGTIWFVTLDNFSCDEGKSGTKSNNSNE